MITTSDNRAIDLVDYGYANNPFVAWENLGAAATLGGTSVLTGGERANAVTGSTYDKWRPDVTTTSANLSFDFGSATSITFAAVASHNAFDHGATVALQHSPDNAAWTTVLSETPTDNKPIAFRLSPDDGAYRYWRFLFSGMIAGDALSVGIAFLGDDIVIPRRLYQGFSPVLTPTEVQLQSNVSVGAHLLGTSIISRGSTLSATISNVDATFIRSAEWLEFQTAFGEGKGFFFAWRPTKYTGDIHYCARDGDVIRPENTGPRDLMNIKFAARVYANG